MNVYMSEQEQLQAIRNWLKKYGPSVIIGIVIAFVASFGWRYWLQHQLQQRSQASMFYEQMLLNQSSHQNQQATQFGNELMQKYQQTPYAVLAGLTLANQAVEQGDLTLAAKNLQWVIENAHDKAIQVIAKLRQARILLAQNKPQDALKLLNTINDKNFLPEIAIVKGDAFIALGDKTSARAVYQQALNTLPPNATIKSMVKMKLDATA